jgi:hypothetical protein
MAEAFAKPRERLNVIVEAIPNWESPLDCCLLPELHGASACNYKTATNVALRNFPMLGIARRAIMSAMNLGFSRC